MHTTKSNTHELRTLEVAIRQMYPGSKEMYVMFDRASHGYGPQLETALATTAKEFDMDYCPHESTMNSIEHGNKPPKEAKKSALLAFKTAGYELSWAQRLRMHFLGEAVFTIVFYK